MWKNNLSARCANHGVLRLCDTFWKNLMTLQWQWQFTLNKTAFHLTIALSKSFDRTPLAGFWGFLDLPNVVFKYGVAYRYCIIKGQWGETSASGKFSFVRGHWVCHTEWRGRLVNRAALIHHRHMQYTQRSLFWPQRMALGIKVIALCENIFIRM